MRLYQTMRITLRLVRHRIFIPRPVKLDVRKFIGRKATVKGIAMNANQWNYLQRLVPRINSAMTDARL